MPEQDAECRITKLPEQKRMEYNVWLTTYMWGASGFQRWAQDTTCFLICMILFKVPDPRRWGRIAPHCSIEPPFPGHMIPTLGSDTLWLWVRPSLVNHTFCPMSRTRRALLCFTFVPFRPHESNSKGVIVFHPMTPPTICFRALLRW